MNWPFAVHSRGGRRASSEQGAPATRPRQRATLRPRVAELEAAIPECLNKYNADPKPFVWTASAASILEKVRRGRQALELVH